MECDAAVISECITSGPLTILICSLPDGHAGLHWDGDDNVMWREGKPDA